MEYGIITVFLTIFAPANHMLQNLLSWSSVEPPQKRYAQSRWGVIPRTALY